MAYHSNYRKRDSQKSLTTVEWSGFANLILGF